MMRQTKRRALPANQMTRLPVFLAVLLAGLLLAACESSPTPATLEEPPPTVSIATIVPAATNPEVASPTPTLPPEPTEVLAEVLETATPSLSPADEDETPAPPPTEAVEPTEPPAPTETPAPLPTETPEPLPTETATAEREAPAPPVATAPPSAGNHGITINGSSQFVAWTEEAIALLQAQAPTWYAQVAASLDTIQEVQSGTSVNVVTRVVSVGGLTAYPAGHSPEKQLHWYAGSLVHESCHTDRFAKGEPWRGRDGELSCLIDQRDALLLIEPDNHFADYIQGLIDGVDDPNNQWWNSEHRHW